MIWRRRNEDAEISLGHNCLAAQFNVVRWAIAMITVNSIAPEELQRLKADVDALDRMTPSLEVLERMVRLVAERFSIPVTARYRGPYLDFEVGNAYMTVELQDGRYHCFHQCMADRYEMVHTATSAAAWYYLVGRLPYPSLWASLKGSKRSEQQAPNNQGGS
jgi:hypothetical protein